MRLRLLHIAYFSAIWLTVCSVPLVRGAEEASTVAPGNPVAVSDRFFADTRNDYRLVGPVEWELGKMKLPPASGLFRMEPMLPDLQMEIHLWPTLGGGEQDTSVTRVSIPASNGWEIIIAIVRRRHQGQLYRQLVFAEVNRGGTGDRAGQEAESSELRQSPPFTFPGDVERWSISYDHGLIKVGCNGQLVGHAYSSAFASWCQGVAVQQLSGTVELTDLNLSGKRSGYTAEQRKAYEDTIRLRIEAERALADGDLYGAVQIEQSRIPIMEEAFDKNDYAMGLVHGWVGDRLSAAGHSEDAIDAYERAAEVYQNALGRMHPETLLARASVGYEMAAAGRLEEADATLRPVLKSLLEIAGPGSSRTRAVIDQYCNLLIAKSNEHFNRREFGEYARQLQERFKLRSSMTDPDAWDILRAKRDYEFAESLASANKTTQKRIMNWSSKVDEVNLDLTKGRHAEALEILKQSLETARELFGEEHIRTVQTKAALSRCAMNCGDPGLAISMAEQVLKHWREHGEENDYELVDALVAVAGTYSIADRYLEAEKLFEEADSICRKAVQKLSNSYGNCMLETGRNQIRMGNNNAARASLEIALKVFTDISDPASESALKTRERLADICRAENDLAGAEYYLDQQRVLILSRYGAKSAPYIDVLASEARHFLMQRNFSEAVTRYETALALAEDTFGKQSRSYQMVLEGLVEARSWEGNDARASQDFLELVDMRQNYRDSLFNIYPERLQFSRVLMDRGHLSIVLQLAAAKQITADDAYKRILSAKGAVTARQRALRVAAQDPALRGLVKELHSMNSQIASALVHTPTDQQEAEISALTQRKNEIESQLAQQSGKGTSHWQANVEELRECLPEDAALVDYIEYVRQPTYIERALGREGTLAMMAFVVTRERGVEFVELTDVESIDKAVLSWLAAIELEPRVVDEKDALELAGIVDERGSAVRKLVWDPLRGKIGDAAMVIISPDGMLVTCPFAAMPSEDGKSYLVDEKTMVHTIAARLLPELAERSEQEEIEDPRFLAVDGVDYGLSTTSESDSAEQLSAPFLPVPFDAVQVQSIEAGFRSRYESGKSGQLTGMDAREDLFKRLAERANFIHLVTHGFCLRASEIRLATPDLQIPTDSELGIESDPIVAGIAFAGANQGLFSASDSDGVLWTDEISLLDLHRAELVVLFACQSTLGSYAPGEGMLGCQRALHVAGAWSSIGTLWSIEVDATREFMKQFYRNYWDGRLAKAEALRATMTHMMWKYPEARGAEKEGRLAVRCPPALWAGFVLSGDWQ